MTKSAKPDDQASTGGVSFNGSGDPVLERRTDDGQFEADVDTQELEALQDSTDVKTADDTATQPEQRPDNNPYTTLDTLHTLSRKKPRRTLDDMRKLSEEIKKARTDKKVI